MDPIVAFLFPFLLVWCALELRHLRMRAAGRSGATIDDRGTLDGIFAVVVPSLLLAFAAARYLSPVFPEIVRAVGLFLMALGLALREWSVVTLGRFFTVDVAVQAGHAVVDRGPYRLIRHPSYSGALLAALGAGLAFGNWISLALAAFPALAMLVWRIRVEEDALARGLGEPYRAYMRRTKRLIPFAW